MGIKMIQTTSTCKAIMKTTGNFNSGEVLDNVRQGKNGCVLSSSSSQLKNSVSWPQKKWKNVVPKQRSCKHSKKNMTETKSEEEVQRVPEGGGIFLDLGDRS